MNYTVKIGSCYFLGGNTKIEKRSGEDTAEIQQLRNRLIGDYPGFIKAPQETVERLGMHFLMDLPLSSGKRLLTVFYKDDTGSRDFWNVYSFAYSKDIPPEAIKLMLSQSAAAWRELSAHEYTGALLIDDSSTDANAASVSQLWNKDCPYAYHFPTPRNSSLTGAVSAEELEVHFPSASVVVKREIEEKKIEEKDVSPEESRNLRREKMIICAISFAVGLMLRSPSSGACSSDGDIREELDRAERNLENSKKEICELEEHIYYLNKKMDSLERDKKELKNKLNKQNNSKTNTRKSNEQDKENGIDPSFAGISKNIHS